MMQEEEARRRVVIGAMARRRREQKRMGINPLARAAGINFRTLKTFEHGETWPWVGNLAKIEEALDWREGTLERLRSDAEFLEQAEADPDVLIQRKDATVRAVPATGTLTAQTSAELLRAGLVSRVIEMVADLPTADVVRVHEVADELGRERYPDWDDRHDQQVWNLALPKGVTLSPPEGEAPQEIIAEVLRRRRDPSS